MTKQLKKKIEGITHETFAEEYKHKGWVILYKDDIPKLISLCKDYALSCVPKENKPNKKHLSERRRNLIAGFNLCRKEMKENVNEK